MAFGLEKDKIIASEPVDLESILMGKVKFMTQDEETDKGKFARVIAGSLKKLD